MTGLEMPMRGVAAHLPGVHHLLEVPQAPETSTAASLVSRFFLNMALSCFAMKPPVPPWS